MSWQRGFVFRGRRHILLRFRSKLPGSALNLMKQQSAVDAAPQIMVSYGHEFTKPLPLPAVRAPFVHAVFQATAHIAAFGDKCHPGRAVDGFKPSYHCQQLQPFASCTGFHAGGRKSLLGVYAF